MTEPTPCRTCGGTRRPEGHHGPPPTGTGECLCAVLSALSPFEVALLQRLDRIAVALEKTAVVLDECTKDNDGTPTRWFNTWDNSR